MPEPEAVEVLGVRFHNLDRAQAARAVVALLGSGEKRYVVKPYSEFMPRARRDDRVRGVLNGAGLCLPDGAGILWAAHYLSLPGGRLRALLQLPLSLLSLVFNQRAVRRPLREHMAGVDFTWQMLRELAGVGASVFLLGGREDEVQGAREAIARRFPQLRIAGAHPGHFRTEGRANEEVIAAVNEVSPDVLLVAMGFPRQELWMAKHLPRLNVKVAVAEGGSFTYMAGLVPRAPRWMRDAGLEWLFRLLRQPWRLRRQAAGLPLFVWLVLKARLSSSRP
jgi:N-acetylglucosaminyldiphosphoundecaprenol N-acetyl-beta-D-mannosaminyltransferase